jgi:hypothetical protein
MVVLPSPSMVYAANSPVISLLRRSILTFHYQGRRHRRWRTTADGERIEAATDGESNQPFIDSGQQIFSTAGLAVKRKPMDRMREASRT